jgi:hypothetical protein
LGAEFVEVPYIDRGKSGFHGDNLEAELGRIKADIQSERSPRATSCAWSRIAASGG